MAPESEDAYSYRQSTIASIIIVIVRVSAWQQILKLSLISSCLWLLVC